MNYIEIKNEKMSFFKSRLTCNSSVEHSFSLRLVYSRLDRLSIYSDSDLILETDGGSYINYIYKGRVFRSKESSLTKEVLVCGNDQIIYEWSKGIGLPVISFSNPVTNVYSQGDTFQLLTKSSFKGRINRLETSTCSDFLFAVGVLAYRWTMEENSDHITG